MLNNRYELGKTGLMVSRVGIGVLPMGPNQKNLDVETGAEVIKYALEKGINFIDTAQYYQTYDHIAKALEDVERKDVVISTKSLAHDYDEMMEAIDEACEKLATDYIDIFLMHEVRPGQFEERCGAWQALQDAKSKGKVRAIGVSTHHSCVTRDMADVSECDVCFSLVNYKGLGIRKRMADETLADLSDPEKKFMMLTHGCLDEPASVDEMVDAIRALAAANKGFFGMKVFGGGNLTSSYQDALKFALELSEMPSFMVGFTSKQEVDDLVNYISGLMPEGYNPDVREKKVRISQEDCEGCGTCMKACASQAISYNIDGLCEIDSSKCLTCGYCAPVCPARAIIMF